MDTRVHRLGNWAVELRHEGDRVTLAGADNLHPVPLADLQRFADELSDMMASADDAGLLPSLGCGWHRSTAFARNWNLVWSRDRTSLPETLVYAVIGDAQALALGARWEDLPEPFASNGVRRSARRVWQVPSTAG